jgi:hypothetical protein
VGLFDPVSHRAIWNESYLASVITQPAAGFAVTVPKSPQALRVMAAGYPFHIVQAEIMCTKTCTKMVEAD